MEKKNQKNAENQSSNPMSHAISRKFSRSLKHQQKAKVRKIFVFLRLDLYNNMNSIRISVAFCSKIGKSRCQGFVVIKSNLNFKTYLDRVALYSNRFGY